MATRAQLATRDRLVLAMDELAGIALSAACLPPFPTTPSSRAGMWTSTFPGGHVDVGGASGRPDAESRREHASGIAEGSTGQVVECTRW